MIQVGCFIRSTVTSQFPLVHLRYTPHLIPTQLVRSTVRTLGVFDSCVDFIQTVHVLYDTFAKYNVQEVS
jgi:hypothetical protein